MLSVLIRTVLIGVLLFKAAPRAFADEWQSEGGTTGTSHVAGFIDLPKSDAVFRPGQFLQVRGWVVDTTAHDGPGIDQVRLFGQSESDTDEQFLEDGETSVPRPDVPRGTGMSIWQNAGFEFNHAKAPGTYGRYKLTVAAHTTTDGWWRDAIAITIAPPPPPPKCVDMICDSSVLLPVFALLCLVPLAAMVGVLGLVMGARRAFRRNRSGQH